MEPWRTAIVDSRNGEIRFRGYDVTALMSGRSFTDVIFLLHQGRLPSSAERRLLDAILIGVADHGSGAPSCAASRLALSGNRQSLSAAVAAGIRAVGDEHGGAGMGCMEMIAAGIDVAKRDGIYLEASATRTVQEARARKKRLPGFGHRVHSVDPRSTVLLEMARADHVAGDGVAFVEAMEKAIAREIKP